ncbi:hypothetical protein [Nonomuraea aurantiaca]|uniref:hypothetical protein n=1 Tax=Nonomuraea aurantiaca TaxID=2878562 RepID=UPI001CD97A5A|nr:hypothetical protein [Nonomuraea aurantiaca]MCA2225627.1 hypothetical protein [Nonomuraea aurantiaca]
MAKLVTAMEDIVSVEYGQFLFLDEDGSAGAKDAPSPWELGYDDDDWLQVTVNGGLVSTGYSDHKVQVRFELWDGAPDDPGDGNVREVEFSATSGRIRLAELVSHSDHAAFDLGQQVTSWKLRAILRELRDPDEVDWETEGFPSDLEVYCLQFWPGG